MNPEPRDLIDFWAVVDKVVTDHYSVAVFNTEMEAVRAREKYDMLYPSLAPHEVVHLVEHTKEHWNQSEHAKQPIARALELLKPFGGIPSVLSSHDAKMVRHAIEILENAL